MRCYILIEADEDYQEILSVYDDKLVAEKAKEKYEEEIEQNESRRCHVVAILETELFSKLQNQLEEAQEEINEYKLGFELTKKEIVKLKETIKAFENISELNEDGYTGREIMYRRIARKYMHKCNTCPLRLEKTKIENAWID